MDCWRKRKHRGYLFMTGDELPYPSVSRHQVDSVIGDRLDEDVPVAHAVAAAGKTFRPFFLIPDLQRRKQCESTWRDLLGDHVVCMEHPADTCYVAAGIIALTERSVADLDALAGLLEGSGAPRERVSAVVRALSPYAALLDKDGTPEPHADPNAAPGRDGKSGWQRR